MRTISKPARSKSWRMPNVVKRLTSSGKPWTPNVNGIHANAGGAGLQHAVHLAHDLVGVVDVLEHGDRERAVEAVVLDRHVQRVADDVRASGTRRRRTS